MTTDILGARHESTPARRGAAATDVTLSICSVNGDDQRQFAVSVAGITN
jgi:hypothetical protein